MNIRQVSEDFVTLHKEDRNRSLFITRNLDIIALSILDLLLFHNLILNGYIGYADMTTLPPFLHTSGSLTGLLTGLSGIVSSPPLFHVHLDPGLAILDVGYLLIFGEYAMNFFYFSWLLLYTFGLALLLRNFTDNRILIFLGGLIGVVNPGVLNVIRDAPTTLYVAPIPWFIAFYYRYRIINASKENLLLSLFPLTLLSIYGPGIPAFLVSLTSVEIYSLLSKRGGLKPRIRESLLISLLILLMFTAFHLNVLYLYLTKGPQLNTYTSAEEHLVVNYGNYSFNAIQQLEFNVISNRFNYYYISLLSWVSTEFSDAIAFMFLIYGVICILSLLRTKSFFPLIFFLLSAALTSYHFDYLGIYQFISHVFPIFSVVDPSEYSPLTGIFLAMGTTSMGLRLDALRYKVISWLPLLLVVFLGVLSGVVMSANLAVVWNHVNLPQEVEQGYNTLYSDIQGESVIVVPPVSQFYFPFYLYNGTVYGLRNPEPCVPPVFPLVGFPKGAIVIDNLPIPANLTNPYARLYYYLFIGNTTGFQYYSKILNVQRILWIGPSVNFNKLYTPYYIPNLSTLENRTGFHLIRDYGSFAILGNSEPPTYRLLIRGTYVEIYPLDNVTSIITPIAYGSKLIISGYTIKNYGGVVEIVSSHPIRPLIITSYYVLFNLLTECIILAFYLTTSGYLLYGKVSELVRSIRLKVKVTQRWNHG